LATRIPEPYGVHGHWVLNARNALDSGRRYERGGRQDPATSSHTIGREIATPMTGLKGSAVIGRRTLEWQIKDFV